MKWLLVALGFLMVAAGGYWAFTGSLIVQVERGWSSVIAGSVVFSTGFLILALGALMGSVDRLAKQMRDAQSAAPRPSPAMPQRAPLASAVTSPVAQDASAEPEDKSQLKLELVPAPAPTPVQHAQKPAAPRLVADEEKLPPLPEPASAPNGDRDASPTRTERGSASATIAEEAAAPVPASPAQGAPSHPEAAPSQSAKPVQNPAVRPVMPRPAPPSSVGRPVMPPPPTARVRPSQPALAPPPPPPPPQIVAEAQPPTQQPAASSEAPVPAFRPAAEPRKVGWLERALEGPSPDELAVPKPAAPPPAPTPGASSAQDAPVKIAGHEVDEDKPAAAPTPVRAAEGRSGGGLNNAEVDEVEASVEPPKQADPAVDRRPAPDAKLPPEPVRLPVTRSDELESASPAMRIPEPPAIADLPKIMRKYESQGVRYTLYEDGSIDADSGAGRFRFASLDELRIFLENKN